MKILSLRLRCLSTPCLCLPASDLSDSVETIFRVQHSFAFLPVPAWLDNTAYMVGSLFGKHKLCPYISPNKTVEGAVSGVVGGALGGVVVYFAQKLWGLDVSLVTLIAVCFIAGIVGQFGDLLASTFKRWAGVKDYSNLFPGHGGVMDRLDSAMVAAPIVAVAFAFFI